MANKKPHKQRILVIDDDDLNITLLTDILSDNYEILSATNGQDALSAALSEHPPDLILLDRMMPGMDGVEVCRRLKADTRTQNIPVIFVTAIDGAMEQADGFSSGAVDYITKPLRPAIVKARVDNHLHLKLYQDHLEDLVNQRMDELLESEKRFRHLVENLLVGVCIVQDGRVVYMNSKQKEIFGDLPDDFEFRNLNIHPEDHEKFIRCFDSMWNTKVGCSEMALRFCPYGPEGESHNLRYVLCNACMIDYQGRPAFLINMIDRTKSKELEEILQIREKMASLGHVAAGIAHEIRNPLSGINVLLDGIEDHFEDPDNAEDIRELLREAKGASEKISGVIRRVIDFTRPTQLQLKASDINHPIREAIKLAATALRKSEIKIETALDETLPKPFIDGQLMEQVILNLVNNASEALKKTQGEKLITLSTSRKNGEVLVSVGDSGPGIPKEVRDKIFNPFYTTSSKGSGIGLSLCQRIITDHGGTIKALQSKYGGAEFSIAIPLEKRANQR